MHLEKYSKTTKIKNKKYNYKMHLEKNSKTTK